jgi:hypothetical protein
LKTKIRNDSGYVGAATIAQMGAFLGLFLISTSLAHTQTSTNFPAPITNHASRITDQNTYHAPSITNPPPEPTHQHQEQIRAACIQGRRVICGRVTQVLSQGLVVESGYTNLLRRPLTQSWVAPSTVSASRDPRTLEIAEPGSPCVGLVFLTDIPKRPPVHQYDYVLIPGYPCGSFSYTSVPGVTKTIRKFAAGLDTAVRLSLQETQKTP